MVQAALGGCLFLDEAYALSGGGRDGDRGDSFSDEYSGATRTHARGSPWDPMCDPMCDPM
eukprot:7381302-Prymnesium_polylepis.1